MLTLILVSVHTVTSSPNNIYILLVVVFLANLTVSNSVFNMSSANPDVHLSVELFQLQVILISLAFLVVSVGNISIFIKEFKLLLLYIPVISIANIPVKDVNPFVQFCLASLILISRPDVSVLIKSLTPYLILSAICCGVSPVSDNFPIAVKSSLLSPNSSSVITAIVCPNI